MSLHGHTYTWNSFNIINHALNVDPSYIPFRQKQRSFDVERSTILKEEATKHLDNDFIGEPTSLSGFKPGDGEEIKRQITSMRIFLGP